jgi:hypothetical protein
MVVRLALFLAYALFAAHVRAGNEAQSEQDKPPSVEVQRKCEACHVVIDSFYQMVQDQFKKRKGPKHSNVEIRADQLIFNVCDDLHKKAMVGEPVIKLCRAFLEEYRAQIMDTFSTTFEVSDNVDHFYNIKRKLCNTIHAACVIPEQGQKMSQCEACTVVMNDIERVFSWGVGRSNFASKELTFQVLDDICLHLPVRHPIKFHHRLLETCNDLIDDYSTSIVTVLNKAVKERDQKLIPAKHICTTVTNWCEPSHQEL